MADLFDLRLPCELWVDHREHNFLVEEFTRLGAHIGAYQVDYHWKTPHGLAVVTRKSLEDARRSIIDGTFGAQVLQCLNQAATWVFVLLELDNGAMGFTVAGTMTDGNRVTGFSINSLLNFLTSQQRLGAYLHLSPDLSMTPWSIVSLMEYTLNPHHTSTYRPRKRDPEQPLTLRTLLTVPGIDAVKTRGLSRAFPTIQALANAQIPDLVAVKGVGKSTAARIHHHFREPLMREPE